MSGNGTVKCHIASGALHSDGTFEPLDERVYEEPAPSPEKLVASKIPLFKSKITISRSWGASRVECLAALKVYEKVALGCGLSIVGKEVDGRHFQIMVLGRQAALTEMRETMDGVRITIE